MLIDFLRRERALAVFALGTAIYVTSQSNFFIDKRYYIFLIPKCQLIVSRRTHLSSIIEDEIFSLTHRPQFQEPY